jgi:outer membrane protein OmpA-like peptidoglycan-associated protein
MADEGFKRKLAAMGYQNIKSTILIIYLCFSTITGCAVIQGTLIKTYESEYHDTVQASSDTLKNLKIPVTEKMSDELKTVINAERFDGTPVTIEVVRIDRNLTEVSVRTGIGLVWDKRVSTQIHEFISENLIQQAKDDTKHTENLDKEGIQGSLDEATKQGITEEDIDDYFAQEIIPAESTTEFDDQIQSKRPPKLTEIFSDSVFLIFFNQDSNELSAKALEKLDRVAEIIFNNQKVEITLNGYTDSFGSPSYNKIVSESRANAVKVYLIRKGVEPSKIKTMGYGAQNFLASNKTKEGRRFNRRVEIELNNLRTK